MGCAVLALLLVDPALARSGEGRHEFAALIERGLEQLPLQVSEDLRDSIASAYARRAHAPFWLNGSAPSARGIELLRALQGAAENGIDPSDYRTSELSARLERLTASPLSASALASVDIALSVSAASYGHDLHYGRVLPRDAGFDMPARSASFDAGQLLEDILQQGATKALAAMEPPFHHYRALKTALARYRQLALDPHLTALSPPATTSIRAGDEYAGAPELRRLLTALGDLQVAPAVESRIFDEALAAALERFQFRHGLTRDGVLGRQTFAALTVPLQARVRQIELTLERFRWLPALDGPSIIVNIPQFRLFAFRSNDDSEAQMLSMDVIVGRTFNPTPAFAGDMKYLIFRPYWDVPYSIAKAEILPRLRRDPAYLDAQNMEIVDSQSDRANVVEATPQNIELVAKGKYRVRQRPGPENALGLVKFMLPNHYNVYLHSTPAQQLFQRSQRAFSHGCIRVSDPIALAQYVLRDTDWTREEIVAAMQGAAPRRVNLPRNIRVLILYGTAVASEAGRVSFFEDLYGNDARLEQLLARRRMMVEP